MRLKASRSEVALCAHPLQLLHPPERRPPPSRALRNRICHQRSSTKDRCRVQLTPRRS
ncbi:hypothetical protein K438DRAFT_1851475 [Mycena galopus ATCC 62051]|nr:hypothetical protein K438DRAFT_1851475 [Mycena galopus ATCC 62051]